VIRRLFTAAAAISLLLCVVIAVLWIISYWMVPHFSYNTTMTAARPVIKGFFFEIRFVEGTIYIEWPGFSLGNLPCAIPLALLAILPTVAGVRRARRMSRKRRGFPIEPAEKSPRPA
jgi:hypothetical protein